MSTESNSEDSPKLVYVLSDGTGETVEKIVQATLTQYANPQVNVIRYKNIRTREQAEAVCEDAARKGAAVVYTVVNAESREAIAKHCGAGGIKAVDLLGPLMETFTLLLGEAPALKSGLFHEVNEKYFRRIEAMEFAVKQDDGASPENLQRADVILVGVSRTSKTPLSIYLSHRGWKVANIPLVKGIEPPEALFEVNQNKVVALTIDPEALAKIRRERLVRMGREPTGDYASLQHIRDEIEWARQLFERHRRWPVFNVTNKALEETAGEIERAIASKLRQKT